jgi:transcription elongation factor GreA
VTQTSEAAVTWLTQEAYDRLQAELDQLSGPGRAEMASRIAAAREEGDLRENGGYHAAKEEQGKQEARIRQLERLLRTAKVGEAPAADVAGPGMVVTVRYQDEEETERFLLGSREDATHDESLPIYSAQSPLGRAITGKRVGETAAYQLPSGREMAVTVVELSRYTS